MTTTLLRATSDTGLTLGGAPRDDRVDRLSPRELEVLMLMAEGRSNLAIGHRLGVELKTVETHVGRVFTKLGLGEDRHENRRVLAVLSFLGRRDARHSTSRTVRSSQVSRRTTSRARPSPANTTGIRRFPL